MRKREKERGEERRKGEEERWDRKTKEEWTRDEKTDGAIPLGKPLVGAAPRPAVRCA